MGDDTTPAITRRRETTRQRLLDAAAQVFAETGLDAASVEAVCERAGFTRGAFYSNFDSKEALLLQLCARTARERVAAVRERVDRFEAEGAPADPAELVRSVLEVGGVDRLDVLLFGEIRVHALRTPALAAAFVAQHEELIAGVAQIVADICATKGMRSRVEPLVAARILLTTRTAAAEWAELRGLDETAKRARLGEALAEVAEILLDRD